MNNLQELFFGLLITVFLVACIRTIGNLVVDWQAKKRSALLSELDKEVISLCEEVAKLTPVQLTTEIVPQRFPSKSAAQSFGDRWSLGGAGSFRAKACDSHNRDEDHPHFDKASIAGGILYSYPALFFGMKEAYREDDEWQIGFAAARNEWLRKYLDHLRREN